MTNIPTETEVTKDYIKASVWVGSVSFSQMTFLFHRD